MSKIGTSYNQKNLFTQTTTDRSSHRGCSVRKGALRNFAKFTGKQLCQSLFFNKESLAQVSSCEFCEISKNTFFAEHLWAAASAQKRINGTK